jgi:glycosyltransferase involved in cell wall biosynthesis
MRRIAFVIPWYGPDILGGAEAEARRTAERLCQAGLPVEVLTTCVRDLRADWGLNYHRPGVVEINGVMVRRFPVRKRDRAAFDAVNWKLMHNQPVTPAEEQIFVHENVCSPALVDYIGKHQDEYIFIFIPYMFGTTYWGIAACKGKALLIPCLHDESYARMGVFRQMFTWVQRLIFLSPAEMELACSLYPWVDEVAVLIGGGVDTDFTADGEAFRHTYGVTAPFILYAGRKDHGKNVDLLVDYFRRYQAHRSNAVELVLIGGGALPVEVNHHAGIKDLGFVPLQEKYNAYAAATILCQPSLKESFSLVLMEAWIAGTPALVHAGCAVTREHCQRSNGGLYFADYSEFEACLDLLLSHPALRAALGANGRRYVMENYRWDIIVERYCRLLNGMRFR